MDSNGSFSPLQVNMEPTFWGPSKSWVFEEFLQKCIPSCPSVKTDIGGVASFLDRGLLELLA